MAENGKVTITINDRELSCEGGRLLIDVAEEADIFVPRFCYHPGMDPVAACRMCLVEIEGSKRPLEPACITGVSDGMVVRTDSEIAVDAQEAVLEMLLINHPLDCPICDRGGECPLQDQTLRFGPGRSRYVDAKRHYPKPIPISELVLLDRERCVLCWRCTRFAEEVAGDPFIDLMDRGSLTQINIAGERPFDSYFSGNTIQICPVGALTSSSYRFLSRPWDLVASPTVCSYCAVGCPISIEQRGGEVLRAQGLPNEHVNSFWICDKGRFGHRYPSHPDRLRTPLIRRTNSEGEAEFTEGDWDEALDLLTERLRAAVDDGGPGAVAMVGGSHLTNEDLYAAARFFRESVGTRNLDFRVFDAGFPYEALATGGFVGSTAGIDDLDGARSIVWFGPDPREELPVLYLRLRSAVLGGARLAVIHPRRISLCSLPGAVHLTPAPGAAGDLMEALATGHSAGVHGAAVAKVREWLDEGEAIVCAGPQFAGRPDPEAVHALRRVVDAFDDVPVLLCPPNANSQGALDMGVWPRDGGLDTEGILRSAASGQIRFMWFVGADIVSDFPDSGLAEAALASDCFVVVSDLFPNDTARSADLILPAAALAEKEGSITNLERRIQKVDPAVPSPGVAREDWQIFRDAARGLGVEFDWSSSSDIAAEIAERLPTHAAFTWERLGHAPPPLPQSVRRAGGSWPLTWELRAVDATRRRGWVWDGISDGGERPSGALRSPGGERALRAEVSARSPRYPLRLMVARTIFDGGEMVTRSADLHNVTPPGFVELHPSEAEVRGLSEGAQVTVASARGRQTATLRVSHDTPEGLAFVPLVQPGFRANLLIDLASGATFVEVSA